MNSSSSIPAWIVGSYAAWLAIGLCIYGLLLKRLFRRGGMASTEALGPPDAGLACFFITWFCWIAYTGFTGKEHEVTDTDLIFGAIHLALIVLLITAFLRFRKIGPASLFGLHCTGFFMAALLAVPLLLAAFPLVSCAGMITLKLLGGGAKQQELVQFFNEASNNGHTGLVASTMAFGIFLAPAAEEFIFRGYLYSTAKRYFGIFPAMILTSLLFAAIHLNLASLPSLFVLAVCFSIAYEITGSIFVPMAMHALFNLGEFCLMLAGLQQ